MSDLDLTWVRQNPDFNTYRNDFFPSTVSIEERIFVLYQTDGNIRNGDGFKGGYDIALYECDLSGSIQARYQRANWNTDKNSRLSIQSIATDGTSLFFTYWTKGSISSSSKTGRYDIVVCKTNLNGEIQWIVQDRFPNTIGDNIRPVITANSNGDVFVAFLTNETIQTDSNAQHNGVQDNMNLVVVKLNGATGDIIWSRQRLEFNPENGSSSNPYITTNGDDVVVAYTVSDALPNKILQSRSSLDIVLTKFNGINGDVVWSKEDSDLNTKLTNTTPIINTNATGDIYLAYSTSGLVNEENTSYKVSRTGNTDIVIARLDTNGNVLWLRQRTNFNSIGNDTPYSIQVDSNDGVFISYTVMILAQNQLKILREDAVILRLTQYGDIDIIKYDEFLNYQSFGYIHQTPKILLFNNGNTIFICHSFLNSENTVIFNQQLGSVVFQTKSDIVMKRFDIPSNDQGGNGFKIWSLEGEIINTSGRDISPTIIADRNYNVYTMYKTNGNLPGYTLKGSYDISIFKTNKDGELLWKKQESSWNTAGKVTLSKSPIIIDNDDNLYVAYSTRRFPLDGQVMTGIEDIAILKIDKDGDLIWSEQNILPNTSMRNHKPTLALDGNNLIVAFTTDGVVDNVYQGTANSAPVKTGRKYDLNVVVFKFNTISRSVVWTLQHPNLNCPFGSISQLNVSVTSSSDIILSYLASNALTDSISRSKTSTDVVLIKLDTNANIQWRKQDDDINSKLTNSMPTMTINKDDEIILAYNTSGHVKNTVPSNYKGSTDIILSKLDLNGNLIWNSLQSNTNTFSQDSPNHILTDNSNNIFLAYTTYLATIDNQASQREDVVLMKLDTSGNLIFAIQDDTFNKRIGSYRHVQPRFTLDGNGGIISVFGISNFNVLRSNKNPIIDRGFSIQESTRAIGDTTTQDDEDVEVVKTTDTTTGSGEGNITQTNDGTGDTGDVAEAEEDPTIEEDTTINLSDYTGAVLYVPIVLDASADSTVYVEAPPEFDHSFNVRITTEQLTAPLLSSFIQYVEVEPTEDDPNSKFHFIYNDFVKEDIISALFHDFTNVKGELIRADSNLPEFVSGYTIANNTLGVLFLQYIADILFNHPFAQAPIKNDQEIIDSVNIHSKLNEQFVEGLIENLMERSTYIESSRSQQATSRNDQLQITLEQMFTQDFGRFTDNTDGVPESFPFQAGDEITVLLRMSGSIKLDQLQDFSSLGKQFFTQSQVDNFLKDVLEGYNIDSQYIDLNTDNFLVSKNWKLTFILS